MSESSLMFIELLHSEMKLGSVIAYYKPEYYGGSNWVRGSRKLHNPQRITYYGRKKRFRRERFAYIEFMEQTGAFTIEYGESHRKKLKVHYKVGDPRFKMAPLAKFIKNWLTWKTTYETISGVETQ